MTVIKKKRIKSVKKIVYGFVSFFGTEKINPGTREMLERLYPGESYIRKYQDYQVRKYTIMFLCIMTGIVAAVCVHLSSRMNGRLVEGTCLIRNEWEEGNYFVTLRGITDSGEGEIAYEVKERLLTEEERTILKEQASAVLPEIILGDNESLKEVSKNLNLVTEISGYPFRISWQSGDHDRIRTDGKVNTANLSFEGKEILLTAVFSYGEEIWKQDITVKLVPAILTPKEQYLAAMEEMILENDSLYEEDHEIYLPDQMGDELVTWEEIKSDNSFLLLILGFLGAAIISLSMDRDLKQKGKLRKEEMLKSYPEFVSRVQLYMGAGLTVKNTFLRIGKEYQAEKNRTGKKKFLYEEVLISGYEFLNGKPEDIVYQEWGKRCGEMKYRKLSFLLASHLKQGNDKILSLLSEETAMALEDRKSRARRQGEEAGTKLLLPMMLMLIVVMFLILLPAFSGFGSL
ncbi:MAG: immunoglobulin-like domain-containing protein [Suilimivivens sp.]